MPIICTFTGIKIYIHYNDHMPPHFHAYPGEYECCIDINNLNRIDLCKDMLYLEGVTL